jgi:hypothetical protein
VAGAASKITSSYNGVALASTNLAKDTESVGTSMRELTVAFSGIATAGFSLYMSFDRIEKSQVALDRANLNMKRSTEAVDQATKNYNETVAKYGVSSVEAKDAADKLAIAQEALTVSQERASLAQGNVNQSMMMMALSVVPTMITMTSGASKALDQMGVSISATNAALSIGLIGSLITLAVVLVNAYNTCKPFRDAINGIGEAISDFFMPQLNLIGGALQGFANWVTGAGNAAKQTSQDVQDLARHTQELTYATNKAVKAAEDQVKAAAAQRDIDPQVAENMAKLGYRMNDITNYSYELSQSFRLLDAAADTSLGDIKKAYEAALNKHDFDAMAALVWDFHDKWTISLDEAKKDITNYTDKQAQELAQQQADLAEANAEQQKLLQDHADTLNTYYTDKFVKSTQQYQDSLATSAENINAIMDNQNMSMGLKLALSLANVEKFRTQWHLTWDEAEKDLASSTTAIVKSIDEQLVGKAQADLQAFKDCSSGKFAGISAFGTKEMSNLVADTNDLLSRGLVGQAQANIKAFQDCSTNKAADMAKSIKASMDAMVSAGITSAADMAKYATLEDWYNKLMAQAVGAAVSVAAATKAMSTGAPVSIPVELYRQGIQTQEAYAAYLASLLKPGGGGPGLRMMQEGGVVMGPTFALLGESGSEVVIPLSKMRSVQGEGTTVQINSPLIFVQGNADRETVKLAAQEVLAQLKTIIVEPSSYGASATQKRIRKGATF